MNLNLKVKTHSAFTLIELLLVVALISIVAVGSVSVVRGFLEIGQITNATQASASAIRVAQRRATSSTDFPWGVRFTGGTAVVFRGASYAARNTAFDINYSLEGVTTSGISEVVFAIFTGIPSQTGTININNGNNQSQLTINAKGTVLY